MAQLKYPFAPRSSSRLTPGDYWSVPLEDGSFACGRVIELAPKGQPGSRVSFLGGLLNWHGKLPPHSEKIADCWVIAQGVMHILAINATGGEVLGNRPLALDRIEPFEFINGATIQRGYTPIRAWVRSDNDKLPCFSSWGYDVISLRAHKQFLGYIP